MRQFLTRGKGVLSAIKVSEATLLSARSGSVHGCLNECLQRAGLSLGIKTGIFPAGQSRYTDLFLIYSLWNLRLLAFVARTMQPG